MTSIVRIKESAARLGISVSTLYDWQNPRSPRHNHSFPQRIKLGRSAAGILEEELDEWIRHQKANGGSQ